MADILAVLMRWLHIGSVAALIGGAIFGRFVAAQAADTLNPETKDALWEDMAAHFKPVVYAAVSALLLSGGYNIVSHPGHSATYLILLGIKLLLALHVFAVMVLSVQPNNKRRVRMMAGAAISGLAIIAISGYLRGNF
jgi:uncharacterized membrane protein